MLGIIVFAIGLGLFVSLVVGPCIVLYLMDDLTLSSYKKFYRILFK